MRKLNYSRKLSAEGPWHQNKKKRSSLTAAVATTQTKHHCGKVQPEIMFAYDNPLNTCGGEPKTLAVHT